MKSLILALGLALTLGLSGCQNADDNLSTNSEATRSETTRSETADVDNRQDTPRDLQSDTTTRDTELDTTRQELDQRATVPLDSQERSPSNP